MLTRRQFFANSLATLAGVSLAEWILSPIIACVGQQRYRKGRSIRRLRAKGRPNSR